MTNVKEFVETSGFGWPVYKFPAFMKVGDKFIEVPHQNFTARWDDHLEDPLPFKAVGVDYHVIQNVEGFEFLTSLVDDGDLVLQNALETHGGRTVAINCKKPEHVEIAGQDVVSHIAFMTKHDGSGSALIICHTEQLSCTNQLNHMRHKNRFKYSIRHTKNAQFRLQDAREALKLSFKADEAMKEFGESLATQPIDATYYNRFMRDIVRLDEIDKDKQKKAYQNAQRIRGEMHEILKTADYMGDYKGSKWGLYQMVTHYTSNCANYRQDSTKFMKLVSGHPMTNRAYDLLTA